MRNQLVNNTLTLYFEGELNSYNAENIEKDIEAVLADKQFNELVLDFSNLHYISSAGLRIILKLKQKYDNTRIIEASLEVYDVLSMTGFTNIMKIEKALKRVYLSGAEVVGEGYFSTVYRIDRDTIIKVFNRVSDPDQIQRELRLAKEAFVLGIPTAISFDIVRAEDKLGVRFEMLDCDSLKNLYLKYPERYDELTNKYIELIKKINSTECVDPNMPRVIDQYNNKFEAMKPYLGEYAAKMEKLLKGIKDVNTFVHGDCHFKNIMVQNDELILIDMDTLAVGNPIFELAAIYAPYIAFEEDDPGNNERFLGIKPEFAQKLYHDLEVGCFGEDEKTLKTIKALSYLHMMWWTSVNQKENEVRFNGCKNRLFKLLDELKA